MVSGKLSIVLFGVLGVLGSVSAAAPNVDYQIHSNNDLRELPQLLLKGARKFKFDPHWVSGTTGCQGQTNCLLLNHDTPIPRMANYNSTNDLLNFLESPLFETLRNGEKVTIALCFKSAPDKCKLDSKDFQSWLKLADGFFERAQQNLSPSAVEFVLDGDAKPVNCLIGRWLPLNSVWINSDMGSPADAFYSNSLDNDYYRFAMLNNRENVSNWVWMATPSVNYGKFSNGSYPYQLWEPDSQVDYHEYIDIYRSGLPHASGYNFAINTDMAMFWLYTAGTSSTDFAALPAINQLIDAKLTTYSTVPVDTKPLVVTLSTEGTTLTAFTRDGVIVLSGQNFDKIDSNLVVISSPVIAVPSDMNNWVAGEGDKLVAMTLVESASPNTLMLLSGAGRAVIFQVKQQNGAISIGSWQKIDISELGATFDARFSTVSDAILISSLESSTSIVQLSFVQVTGECPNAGIQILSRSTFPLGSVDSKVSQVRSVLTTFPEAFIFYSTSDDKIFAARVELTSKQSSSSGVRWIQLTVGRNFDINVAKAITGTQQHEFIMLLNDHGYCYNSHTHNTRSTPTMCDSPPVATTHVLDYTFGHVDDWARVLQDGSCMAQISESGIANNSSLKVGGYNCYEVNVCHSRLLHGSYDQGSSPSSAFVNLNDSTLFVGVHEGLSVSAKVNGGCGDPYRRESIVIDAFSTSAWQDSLVRSI